LNFIGCSAHGAHVPLPVKEVLIMPMSNRSQACGSANRAVAPDFVLPSRNFLLQFVRQFDESPAKAAYLKSP
jgi:hypothetical protein